MQSRILIFIVFIMAAAQVFSPVLLSGVEVNMRKSGFNGSAVEVPAIGNGSDNADLDGDGFSRVFEVRFGSNPDDPKSHPELWWRLKVKEIVPVELPVRFMAVVDNGEPDKSAWQLQFNYPDPRRPGKITSQFLMLNDVIVIDNKRYKVVDVKRIITEKKRVSGNLDNDIVDRVDESQVILEEVNPPAGTAPDRLVMIRGKAVFSNDRRPVLVDTGNPNVKRREQVLRIGDTITLGLFTSKTHRVYHAARKREIRVYRLIEVDITKNSVILKDVTPRGRDSAVSEEKLVEVTGEGKVPEDCYPAAVSNDEW